jgi:hypothetical protein
MRPHPALIQLAAGRPVPPFDDHDELARSALEHRMGGLLWSQVAAGAVDGPTAWRERLARSDLVTRNRHHRMWRTLEDISALLAANDIDVAAFKGVAAEHRWYRRMGDRPCSDLDLLLRPDHLDRMDAAMELVQPGHPLTGRAGALAQRGELHAIELFTADGTAIDLHVDAFKTGLPWQRNVLWSRVVELDAPDGGTVRAFDAEASLLHFAINLTKDRFRWLLGYADVARLTTAPDLDAEFLAWWAASEGLEVHYRSALDAVAKTLELDVPPARHRGPRTIVWHAVWRPSIRLRGNEGLVRFRHRYLWVTLLARGPAMAKARFLARVLVPPRELVAYHRPEIGSLAWWLTWGRAVDAVRRWRKGRRLR